LPTLHPINKPKLYEMVLSQIEELINSGDWKPNSKIPSERELKEKLGVSTAVLRETFRVLESRNIIISKRGQGRFLREARPEFSDREQMAQILSRSALLDIIEVRRSLEITALELVISRANDETLNWLERQTKVRGEEKELWENYVDLKNDFDVCLARASGNALLETLVSSLISSLRGLRQRYVIGFEAWLPLHNQHDEIMKAIHARDLPAAKMALNAHLDGVRDALLKASPTNKEETL